MLTLSGESAAGFGFFNAYEQLAKADDLDFVVHVGDYIYEVGILPRELLARSMHSFCGIAGLAYHHTSRLSLSRLLGTSAGFQ